MCLSLRDFICEQRERKLKEFEDIPLEISSTKLYGFFKEAFRDYVIEEVEGAIEELIKNVDKVLENIIVVKKAIKK